MHSSNIFPINNSSSDFDQAFKTHLDSRPRILVVDDEPRVLRSLQAALKSKFEISLANNADMAKQCLQEFGAFDVILTDERMPKCSGLELLNWSKENYPDTARILLSSTDFNGKRDAILLADLYRCISKPWNTQELIEILGRAALKSKPDDRRETTERRRIRRERRSGFSRHCSLAVLDFDQKYRAAYRCAIRDNADISEIYFFDSADALVTTMSHTAGIGMIVVDLSIGEARAVELIRAVNNQHASAVIIVTSDPATIRNFIPQVVGQTVHDFIAKPISAGRIQPVMADALQRYFINKRKH